MWPLVLGDLLCVATCSLLLYSGCSFDENEGGCVRTENHVCRSMQTEIFSIVSDREGATLFMDPAGVDMFKRAVRCRCRFGCSKRSGFESDNLIDGSRFDDCRVWAS